MAFMIQCDNKGCGKITEGQLDKTTNEVYCGDCGKVIDNITQFAKIQLKSMGQIRKPVKEAYAIKCDACKNEALPKLLKGELVCNKCNGKLNVSAAFKPLIVKAIKEKESGDK